MYNIVALVKYGVYEHHIPWECVKYVCGMYNIHYARPRSIIHLIMMIIRGMHHDGGIYFRWCSLLPKKARKMRRRRARSAFSLLTAIRKPKKSLDWKISIFVRGAFFLILYWPGIRHANGGSRSMDMPDPPICISYSTYSGQHLTSCSVAAST